MDLDVLLLAAGFGTRLYPLTRQVPKALLPIYGISILDHHLEQFRSARRIVVNGHHLADKVQAHLDRHPQRARLAFSFEPEILGTGGAIGQAAHLLATEPVVVHNADALFRLPLEEALAFQREGRYLATMVLTRSDVWPNVLLDGDRVIAIQRGERVPRAFTFTGCHVISQEMLQRLPRGGFHDIRDTYDDLIRSGQLGGFVWPRDGEGCLLDIGTPESYLDAHRLCAGEGARRYGLANDPARAREAGKSAAMRFAEGYGFIDARAEIGRDCRIARSVVLENAHLKPGTQLSRTIVGPAAEASGVVNNLLVTTLGTREVS